MSTAHFLELATAPKADPMAGIVHQRNTGSVSGATLKGGFSSTQNAACGSDYSFIECVGFYFGDLKSQIALMNG